MSNHSEINDIALCNREDWCEACHTRMGLCDIGRILAVSDIHGNNDLLVRALQDAKYDPAVDKLYMLGDYIDRGPESKKTVETVMALQERGAIVLKGNHEDMLLRSLTPNHMSDIYYNMWMRNGGQHTLISYGGKIPREHIEWMSNLPSIHVDDNYIFVHAGIVPGIPLDKQDEWNLLWIREDFLLFYQGEKTVVFGHTPIKYLQCIVSNSKDSLIYCDTNMIGIDTGAAFDGPVTVVDIEKRLAYPAYTQVKSATL